jgi:hypothetical protein
LCQEKSGNPGLIAFAFECEKEKKMKKLVRKSSHSVTRRFAKKTAQNEAFLNRIFTQTNY